MTGLNKYYLLIISSSKTKEFDAKRACYAYEYNDIFKVYRHDIMQTATIIFYVVGTREQFETYGFKDDLEKLKPVPIETFKKLSKLDDSKCFIGSTYKLI